MPSLDTTPANHLWLADQEQTLLDFATKIDACIVSTDWAALSTVLNDRQQYLDRLFQQPIPDEARWAIKQLFQSVLQQDETFQARIQVQKDIALKQQMVIEHSRRAIDAYSNQ